MKVAIRTDASLHIGTGHVVRCLTLARRLRNIGCECHFICRSHTGNLNDVISKAGFSVTPLPLESDAPFERVIGNNSPIHAPWLGMHWHTDANQTLASLKGNFPDWLIVDHYGIDYEWEQLLLPHCRRLMVIDDLADREHCCDLLLDQNLVANYETRYVGLVPEKCALLLGPKYALLQPEYAELHPKTPPRMGPLKKIFVYFGGVDHSNLTGLTISAVEKLGRANLSVDVVLSLTAPHKQTVDRLVRDLPWINVHNYMPTLASLMKNADLAIGAAGATTWERCCLGLPSILITVADNQVQTAKYLSSIGAADYIGNCNTVTEQILVEAICKYINDTERLSQVSTRCRALVDGLGTDLLCKLLVPSFECNFPKGV